MINNTIRITYRIARRVVITIIGLTVILIGVALLVLPGPALVVIPAGLAILALEYAWARQWLQRVRDGAEYTWQRWGWKQEGRDSDSAFRDSGKDED